MLTTIEAAALLSERGVMGYKGQPLKADSVKRQCYRGVYPGARLITQGPGRGYWLIPDEEVEAFARAQQTPAQPPSLP
jgi:hypothetical protein